GHFSFLGQDVLCGTTGSAVSVHFVANFKPRHSRAELCYGPRELPADDLRQLNGKNRLSGAGPNLPVHRINPRARDLDLDLPFSRLGYRDVVDSHNLWAAELVITKCLHTRVYGIELPP